MINLISMIKEEYKYSELTGKIIGKLGLPVQVPK